MPKYDFERVGGLLDIVEKCAGHGGKLQHIAGAAMTELAELNDTIKEESIKATKAKEVEDAAKAARVKKEQAAPQTLDDERGDVRPRAFPSDSQTDTIADRRI